MADEPAKIILGDTAIFSVERTARRRWFGRGKDRQPLPFTHCAQCGPVNSAPQFWQWVNGRGCRSLPRPNQRRRAVLSTAEIAVSPRIIFAGSSAIAVEITKKTRGESIVERTDPLSQSRRLQS